MVLVFPTNEILQRILPVLVLGTVFENKALF